MKQLYRILQNYNTINQLENAQTAITGTWIFTSSFIKHEQFDFSLLVKWEIYRKKSISLYYLWLYQKTREMLLKSLIKIVRAHFPWSNLYLYIKY